MFTLRCLARSLPRAAVRAYKPIVPRTAAFLISQPQPVLRSFSTSLWRREPAGDSDEVLSAKLNQERQLELDSQQNDDVKATIDEYLANSPFEVDDVSGTHKVVMHRQFGNETIKIEFSVSDMHDLDEEFDPFEQDNAFDDEEPGSDLTSGGKRTINQSGTKGGKIDVAPEDSIAPSDREDALGDQDVEAPYPLHLNITITKPGLGATELQAEVQSGAIEVSRLSYYPKAELVEPTTPEEVREAQAVYEGPPFTNLDPDLQTMVLQYLEERGIDAELAEFLPQYVDFKEQREYVNYLDNLKKFVDA